MMVTIDDLYASLTPILSRVRTDDSAVKFPDGGTAWRGDEPITKSQMFEHLAGTLGRGACPINFGESTTRLLVLDFDSHRGESTWMEMVEAAQRVADALEQDGVRLTFFRSSGGNGLHGFGLWEGPQDAYSVRQLAVAALARAGMSEGTGGVRKGEVEVFPKQDSVPALPAQRLNQDGTEVKINRGSMIVLPLFRKSEPVDMMLGCAMGREAAIGLTWPMSDDVATIARPTQPVPLIGHSRSAEPIAKVRSALAHIPNDGLIDDPAYDEWFSIICAVNEATGGSDEGLDAANEWSARNPKHDEKFLRNNVWPHIRSADARSGSAVTRATLYGTARDRGWVDSTGIDADGFDDVSLEVLRQSGATAVPGDFQTSEQRMDTWRQVLDRADTVDDIQDRICPRISRDKLLGEIDRALVADLVQTRLRELGANVNLTLVRKLVALKTAKSVERFDTTLEVKPLTEFGNAQRMIDLYGHSLMFVPEHEAWFMWSPAKKQTDGSDGPCVYWRRVSQVEIEHLAKETIRALAREVDSFPDERRAEFFDFCRLSQTAKMVGNMVRLAASDPRVFVPSAELDKHPHLVAARNGVIDLRSGTLHQADSRLRITKVLGCDYDPAAKAPLFDDTLRGVFKGDADMIEFFLRTLGYALQGEPKEDVMIIPYGEGSNGKSTCYGIARKAFGTYARSADPGTFIADSGKQGGGGAREDLVRLHGARLVLVGEPDENGELREGSVKSMTGGDALTARAMYAKSSMEILPTWTIVMPTNHKPIIKGSDHGIWRRLRLIPFEVNFDKDPSVKKDGDREKRLEAELPGILTAIVAAGLRYREKGLTPPGKVHEAVQNYKQDMDLLAEWIDECCELGDFQCPSSQLWDSWARYAQGRGLLKYISNSNALGRRMEQRFPSKKSAGGVRIRLGIRVKHSEDLF